MMKRSAARSPEAEPVGIVISNGPRPEQTPVFLAYEWSPAPEVAPEGEVRAA